MEHFPWNISHETPTERGVQWIFLQLKKRVPPPQILYIVLQDLYEGGGGGWFYMLAPCPCRRIDNGNMVLSFIKIYICKTILHGIYSVIAAIVEMLLW